MSGLLLHAEKPLSGKTAAAVGLAQQLQRRGHTVGLVRLVGDEGAAADARLFASLPFNGGRRSEPVPADAAAGAVTGSTVYLVEAPAGGADVAGKLPVVLVVPCRDGGSGDAGGRRQVLGDRLLGVIATFVPRRRLDAVRETFVKDGVRLISAVTEDRTLAAPTLGDVAAALDAQALLVNGHENDVLDRVYISSISADPSQGYFARLNPNAVIVRQDKPDLQLAALNAGAPCLIVTATGVGAGRGARPPILSYVVQRAEEDEIPILYTPLNTIDAVGRLEDLYGRTRFVGAAKVQRAAELLKDADIESLVAALAK
ncbi:MAG: hypothetical protein HYS09_09975 [Chloroflexi bacterium]|nr:hypothetical protein [Chloroflexota bacterium]